jgi:hypothetical protein
MYDQAGDASGMDVASESSSLALHSSAGPTRGGRRVVLQVEEDGKVDKVGRVGLGLQTTLRS